MNNENRLKCFSQSNNLKTIEIAQWKVILSSPNIKYVLNSDFCSLINFERRQKYISLILVIRRFKSELLIQMDGLNETGGMKDYKNKLYGYP